MKILSYKYWQSGFRKWEFSEVELGKKLNLLVGDSGTGKTRFLNTVFNLGMIARGMKGLQNGCWKVDIEQNGSIYTWEFESGSTDKKDNPKVYREKLTKKTDNKEIIIIERDRTSFKFLGTKTPKLVSDKASIYILNEEEEIKPLFDGFGNILRRNFSEDALKQNTHKEIVPHNFLDDDDISLSNLYSAPFGLNLKLFYLKKKHPDLFKTICSYFLEIFQFLKTVDIKDYTQINTQIKTGGLLRVFCIKEKKIDEWIPLDVLSSGMQKVLLIITDVCTLPDGSIYLVDEYENSLGINAINFLPSFLTEIESDSQFLLTSHHPYIINNIPVENWLVLHRKGTEVQIRYGKDNIARFGKSRQQRFTQLINDPFYHEGVE